MSFFEGGTCSRGVRGRSEESSLVSIDTVRAQPETCTTQSRTSGDASPDPTTPPEVEGSNYDEELDEEVQLEQVAMEDGTNEGFDNNVFHNSKF